MRGVLGIRSRVHGKDERIGRRHFRRRAVQVQTVADQETIQLLTNRLVQVRFVHHDKSVRRVHRSLLKVVAEDDRNLFTEVCIILHEIRVGLGAQCYLTGPAEDVDVLNRVGLEHCTNHVMVSARLTDLNVGPKKSGTKCSHGKDIRDVFAMEALFVLENGCHVLGFSVHFRREERKERISCVWDINVYTRILVWVSATLQFFSQTDQCA